MIQSEPRTCPIQAADVTRGARRDASQAERQSAAVWPTTIGPPLSAVPQQHKVSTPCARSRMAKRLLLQSAGVGIQNSSPRWSGAHSSDPAPTGGTREFPHR
jgi:hypothetical protein